MATKSGRFLEEGHWAEGALVIILKVAGHEAVPSTPLEDHRDKVDLWCRRRPADNWIPIQLSTNPEAIRGEKGLKALEFGCLPIHVDGEELQEVMLAHRKSLARATAQNFWAKVDWAMEAFRPRLQQPRRPLP